MFRVAKLPATVLARTQRSGAPVLSVLATAPSRQMSMKGSDEKKTVQYTAYAMGLLIPGALLVGQPFTFLADYTLALAVPVHMYLGGRSILIDYVPDLDYRRMAIVALKGAAVLTAAGLLKLNLTDVGIVEGFKLLWTPADQITE